MHLPSLATSPLTFCITQTSYTCVAGDNCPAGASLCRWSRLSCLPLHFSFFQLVYLSIFAALVTLAVAAEIPSLPSLLRISIPWQYLSFHASKTRPCTYFHIHNICKHMIFLILAGSYFCYVHPTRMAAAVICFCFEIYGLPPFWRLTRSADSGQNPGGVFLDWARTETGQKFHFLKKAYFMMWMWRDKVKGFFFCLFFNWICYLEALVSFYLATNQNSYNTKFSESGLVYEKYIDKAIGWEDVFNSLISCSVNSQNEWTCPPRQK